MNTAAKTRKTTPMPDASRVKSTMATTRNSTPASAFPTACLDLKFTLTEPVRRQFREVAETTLLGRALDALEPVVRQRLPAGDRPGVDVLRGGAGERVVDRAQADARLVGLGPAAAEQVRAADRAERLRGALLGLVGAEQLLAGEERDLLAADAAVRGADAAGELLAGGAVAERARLEVVRHLELDPTALAAASQRHAASVAEPFSFRLRRGFPGPMLFLLLMLFLFFLLITSAARRSARRRRELAEEYDRQSPGADDGSQVTVGSPFDLLFGGGGGWQSYEYDPQSGRWVDVSQQEPEAPEQPPQEPHEERRPQRKPRRQAPQSPLGSLFGGGLMGGMGGDGSGNFDVQPPNELTNFADVGGMDALKREVADTVGLMLKHPDEAERYGIDWNGILLYGPPGVGKTFFAQAIAGEYGLNFIHVSTGDLVSGIVGGSARNIDKAFETAEQ